MNCLLLRSFSGAQAGTKKSDFVHFVKLNLVFLLSMHIISSVKIEFSVTIAKFSFVELISTV